MIVWQIRAATWPAIPWDDPKAIAGCELASLSLSQMKQDKPKALAQGPELCETLHVDAETPTRAVIGINTATPWLPIHQIIPSTL